MQKKLLVLLVDIVSSRKITDREFFQQRLLDACEEINQEYNEDLYADFKILKGLDEIGAVLGDISNIYHMINKIMDGIYPQKARFIVALDYVNTALESKDVTRMDGPAFHRASKMMAELKSSKLFFDITTGDQAWDRSIKTMINLMLLYKERWTKNQHQIIKDYAETLNQAKVAEKYNITQQAVSKVIGSTRWKYIKVLEDNINKTLKNGAR